MIRRPDPCLTASAASLLVVLAVAGCVPARADSVPTSSSTVASVGSGAEPSKGPAPTGAGPTTGGRPGDPARPTTPLATTARAVPATPSTTDGTRHTTTARLTTPSATVRPGTAVITLATLTIKGRAPKTGYDRALFGQAWADVDRNGCDTRNDILRRDLRGTTLKPGTHGCVVLKGVLDDPYTGTRIPFVRGPGTSNAVQVDHVVALSDAWQKGAQRWSAATRAAFANDPLNLLAVDGPTNLRKGDADAATWLPPLKASRCAYVARQIAVKHRYVLTVTAAERDAMVRVLTSCPGQPLPR